jgi:hypothetical protein
LDDDRILGNHSVHGDNATRVATKKSDQPSPAGKRTMETLTITTEVKTADAVEQADIQAIVELSAQDLALVGGGTANVCFM